MSDSTLSANILLVHHSPTATLCSIRDIIVDEITTLASSFPDATLNITERPAIGEGEVSAEELVDELLAADVVIFGTTANFGYISGALKHYFDVTFAAAHEKTQAKPVSWWIRGGYDTTGAAKAMRSIVTGFGMTLAANPVEFTGDVAAYDKELRELAEICLGAAFER